MLIKIGVNYMIVGRDPAGLKNPENPNEDLYDPTHGSKVNILFIKKFRY